MSRVRAVVTLPYTTGLPEDASVNVFHFSSLSDPMTTAQRTIILDQLEQFYNFSSGVAGDALGGFYGSLVSRAANACSIELFDLDEAEPRLPIETRLWTLIAGDAATQAPPEVALCLSFQAAPVSGIPQARRRGRVYLGPFIAGSSPAGNDGRPSAALIGSAVAAGNFLLDSLVTGGSVLWNVYSRKDDAMYAITDGWVDNEWDTMRSRGRDATARTTYT